MRCSLPKIASATMAIAAAAIAWTFLNSTPAAAQESSAPAPDQQGSADQQDLQKKLANPISDLVSVPFQYNWIYGNGSGPNGNGLRTVLNIQPVVPFTLTKDWNLIGRWIMPYVSQPEALGSRSGFSDIVFSSFFSPSSSGSVTWGVGPVVTLPMNTDPTLGSGKWSAGPTAVILKFQGKWIYGILANQLWSYANASTTKRASVNQAFLQPFVAYIAPGGITYTLQSETTATWNAQSSSDRWTVPINFLVSKLTSFGPFPFSVQFGGGVYVAKPTGGPDWQLRAAFVLLLPRKK